MIDADVMISTYLSHLILLRFWHVYLWRANFPRFCRVLWKQSRGLCKGYPVVGLYVELCDFVRLESRHSRCYLIVSGCIGKINVRAIYFWAAIWLMSLGGPFRVVGWLEVVWTGEQAFSRCSALRSNRFISSKDILFFAVLTDAMKCACSVWKKVFQKTRSNLLTLFCFRHFNVSECRDDCICNIRYGRLRRIILEE